MPDTSARQPPSRGLAVILYATLCILTMLAALQMARSLVMVTVDMDATVAGTMQVAWRDNASQYSVFKSKKIPVSKGRQTYFLILWSLVEVDKIAVKPIGAPAHIAINSIIIRALGYDQVVFDTDKHFEKFKPNASLTDIAFAPNQFGFRTLDKNAQFEFEVMHPQINEKNAPLIDLINLKVGLIAVAVLITLGFAYQSAHWLLLVVGIVGGFVYFSPFPTNFAVINLKLHSEKDDHLAIYWAKAHEPYTEQQVRRVDTQVGKHTYPLVIGNLEDTRHVRIDPLAATGKVYIDQIEIKAFGYDPIVLNAGNQFLGAVFSKIANST